jgi:uncharacterized protein YjdB
VSINIVIPKVKEIDVGTTLQLTAVGIYSDGSTQDLTSSVTWNSSSIAIVEVSNIVPTKGLITVSAYGSATISVSLDGITNTTEFNLRGPNQPLSLEIVTGYLKVIEPGSVAGFKAIGTYKNGSTKDLTNDVTWTSSDPAVASVSNTAPTKGVLTAHTPGSMTLSAAYGPVNSSYPITVRPPKF